jgi:hypothetical protein
VRKPRQPRVKTIPPKKHDNYALFWNLADGMANRSCKPPESCWLELMDAFWAGLLPKLYCFSGPIKGSRGRSLLALPTREVLGGHLLGHQRDINAEALAELRGLTLTDYEKHEPFRFFVTRDPRFGLAARCADFERLDRRIHARELLRYPKRDGGGKPTKRDAAKKLIAEYPDGKLPPGVSYKKLAQEVGCCERTVARALGRK